MPRRDARARDAAHACSRPARRWRPKSFDYVYQASRTTCACRRSPAAPTSFRASRWAARRCRSGAARCSAAAWAWRSTSSTRRQARARSRRANWSARAPFPSMPIGFWNDPDGAKYHAAYFERFPGVWCHGDYAELTAHGGMIIYGRSDATLNPGGVRIGTAEIYRQVEQLARGAGKHRHRPGLATGSWATCAWCCSCGCATGSRSTTTLSDRIRQQIRANTTPRHVPAKIVQVARHPAHQERQDRRARRARRRSWPRRSRTSRRWPIRRRWSSFGRAPSCRTDRSRARDESTGHRHRACAGAVADIPLAQQLCSTVSSAMARSLERRFNAGSRQQGAVAATLALLPPVVIAGAVYWGLAVLHPLLALLLDIAVLYVLVGFRHFSHAFTAVAEALKAGDAIDARRQLAAWRGVEASGATAAEIPKLAIERGSLTRTDTSSARCSGSWCCPDPSARSCIVSPCCSPGAGPPRHWRTSSASSADRYSGCCIWLDWVPVRLTAVTFAVVGDFEDAIACWRAQAKSWPSRTRAFCSRAAPGRWGRCSAGRSPGRPVNLSSGRNSAWASPPTPISCRAPWASSGAPCWCGCCW